MRTDRRPGRVAAIALVTALLAPVAPSWGVTAFADDDIGEPASASASADRGPQRQHGSYPVVPPVANAALAGCDTALLQRLVESDPAVAQWIMVTVPSNEATTGELAIATVVSDVWRCTLASTTARVGRAGVSAFAQRRSGDGTTPAGIFPLGVVATPQGPISFFGNSANPGALGPYRRVQPGDCYGANPGTAGYGHWRVDSANCAGDDELLQNNVQSYEHAVIIGANTEPTVSGDAPGEIPYASAIFLHRTSVTATGASKATSGCVSIGHDQLVTALRTINPTFSPRFAIGARATLLATPPRSTAGDSAAWPWQR
jgi:L,D-peptidoglycan transpeptidase YkuD (ErfK/YbiS/YcfS/YnhG family)